MRLPRQPIQGPVLKLPDNISIEAFRRRLATANALPQLAVLGLLTGLVTAVVIISFRYLIEYSGIILFGMSDAENFESLDMLTRSSLVLGGALLLGLLMHRYGPSARRVGVVHVMERLSRHQGYLPLRNAVIQFFGGAIALISGQSGGREGPAIHLGATAASLLGQQSKLPNNSIRTMVACGTAAAIASCFNTPIAGVIFAMEVVMMEYTVASFVPIIVASVSSTLVTQYFFGGEPAFTVGTEHTYSVLEIPYLVLGGLIIGAFAAGFIQLIQAFARLASWPFYLRVTLAGGITAACALVLPQVLGVGYDTVNQIMVSEVSMLLLIGLLFAKALCSAATVGMGMPVGLIGPTMVIGACLGGIFGNALNLWQGIDISIGLYVMIGMCAMMAAVLQAPLAALMAVLEMTANTNIVLPAMVTIVVATIVTSQVFGQRSVYISTLNTLGLQYPPNPVTLHLQRIGVSAIMDRSFVRLPSSIPLARAGEVIESGVRWILVENNENDNIRAALNSADLAAFVHERDTEEKEVHLLELPGERMDVTTIDALATAAQVQDALLAAHVEACVVTRTTAPLITPITGIVTRRHLDNYRNFVE
ncbi:MAG: chloride channel protein [Pseudomonadales bacterium]|nr:chloride channel protein [Pseudomonadales bacterium]